MSNFKKSVAIFLSFIMMFTLVSCAEEEQVQDKSLNAVGSMLVENSFLDDYKKEPQKNAEKIVGFGFTAEDFKKKFADSGTWNGYNIRIQFGNSNEFGITVFGIDVAENGKNGVYISTASDAVMGLPSSFTGTQDYYCRLIADSALSTSDILKALSSMGISLVYADASNGLEELSEAKPEQLLYSVVDFALE